MNKSRIDTHNVKAAPPLDDTPLISIIVPAYNAEAFILDAIKSITAQCYPALEILIVDDGSQDSTVALVREACPSAIIIQQTNAGAAAARNTGLKAARGKFLCFLDADDCWLPGKLEAQIKHLKQYPETGAVFHQWFIWHPDSNGHYATPHIQQNPAPQETDAALSGWIYHHLLLDCVVHTSTVMMRREVLDQVGLFKAELVTGEDYDYWLRVSQQFRIDKLRGTYSFYRAAEGSLTSKPKQSNNEYNVLKQAVDRWGTLSPDGLTISKHQLTERLANLAFDFGYAHFYRGSAKTARQAFIQCLKHEPSRWRAFVYYLATFVL